MPNSQCHQAAADPESVAHVEGENECTSCLLVQFYHEMQLTPNSDRQLLAPPSDLGSFPEQTNHLRPLTCPQPGSEAVNVAFSSEVPSVPSGSGVHTQTQTL